VLHGAIVRSIAAGHGLVAVASSLGPIAMFTATGEPRPALAGHPNGSDSVAIDPTGTIVASGGQDRVVRVWRIADGSQLAALEGPEGDTHYVIATADHIISGSNGGTVLAWSRHGETVDAKSRVLVYHHTGAVTALAVSHSSIASAGRDAILTRSLLAADRIASAETTAIPNAALAVGVDDHGTVHAVTRNATAIRWSPGERPVVEIDHGVRDGTGVGARWVDAFDDGTFVVVDPLIRSFEQLRVAVRAATSFQLPH